MADGCCDLLRFDLPRAEGLRRSRLGRGDLAWFLERSQNLVPHREGEVRG